MPTPAYDHPPRQLSSATETRAPILLVDDDPDAIFLIRRTLEQANVAQPVIAFDDSEDALVFLRGFTQSPPTPGLLPCVMFLDIKMPKVHGFVLLKWVRRQPEFDRMYVVMLSGSDEPADQLRAEKLGADRYLVKYPRPDELGAVVAEANKVGRATRA